MLGGGLLSLEPAALNRERRQDSNSGSELLLDLPDWGADSGVFSSLANSVSSGGDGGRVSSNEDVAAALAAHAARLQRQWKQEQRQQDAAAVDFGQLAVSPTADKENQGREAGGAKRKGQKPGAIDWQDFLSGEDRPWSWGCLNNPLRPALRLPSA